MSEDNPREDRPEEGVAEEPAEEPAEDVAPPGPRIPDLEGGALETKRFMVAGGASLRVRAYGADITQQYGPISILTDLAEQVARVLKGFNGGDPMLFAMIPGHSMDLWLGDPAPEDMQGELIRGQTLGAATAVAELIELDGTDLMARATDLSTASVRGYDQLAHFVASHGLTIDWQPEEQRPSTLDHERAELQHRLLTAAPPPRDRTMRLNGVLYRLIEDPLTKLGRIGVGLFDWSLGPPGYPKPPCKVIVEFEGGDLHEEIKRLIGEPVEAEVVVSEPRLGSAVGYSRARLTLTSIIPGKGDLAEYGEPLFELDDSP